MSVTARDVHDAAQVVSSYARETPVLPAMRLSRETGRPIFLKLENVQVTGSFKVRGAVNRLSALSDEQKAAGVVAASAGNHAQAVAWAARRLGTTATLYMPADAPLAKIAAVSEYGGHVELVEGAFDDAVAAAREAADSGPQTLIHAFDDPLVIAGQGTVGLELLRQLDDLKLVVVPLGGGGLASGIALAVKDAIPDARVVGVQSAACAPYTGDAPAERPSTICDGIAVKHPGQITAPLVEQLLDDIVTVSDDEVAQAMVALLERSKQVVEGAGAVGLAALRHRRVKLPDEGQTVAILSGGNVDATLLVEAIRLAETSAGRRMVLATKIPDRPGGLATLLGILAQLGANVLDVEHLRDGIDLHVRETAVQLVLQTRGPDHDWEIVEAVKEAGYEPRLEH